MPSVICVGNYQKIKVSLFKRRNGGFDELKKPQPGTVVKMNGKYYNVKKKLSIAMKICSKTCLGDSGSPAVKKENGQLYIYGIYSLSTGMCGGDDEAAFYVDVFKFLDWIKIGIENLLLD